MRCALAWRRESGAVAAPGLLRGLALTAVLVVGAVTGVTVLGDDAGHIDWARLLITLPRKCGKAGCR